MFTYKQIISQWIDIRSCRDCHFYVVSRSSSQYVKAPKGCIGCVVHRVATGFNFATCCSTWAVRAIRESVAYKSNDALKKQVEICNLYNMTRSSFLLIFVAYGINC